MAEVTVKELAKTVGVSEEKLLSQIKEAGLPHASPDEPITNEDKNTLLMCLRQSHGGRETPDAAPRKITLKRKTSTTLTSPSGHGRGKTVNVEVRKKRTYVKRSALPEQEQPEEAPVETPEVAELEQAPEQPAVAEAEAAEQAEAATTAEEATAEATAEQLPTQGVRSSGLCRWTTSAASSRSSGRLPAAG